MTNPTIVPATCPFKPNKIAGIWHFGLILCLSWTAGLISTPAKAAVLFSNLVSFNGTNGASPSAKLVQALDGNFYGVASLGGSGSSGVGFQLTSNNFTLNPLVNFAFTNGYKPNSLIQGNDGNLYGTTTFGGTNNSLDSSGFGFGTVFQFTTNGVFTSLFSFAGTNGTSPIGLVQATNGTFFGTLNNGSPTESPLNSFAFTSGGLFTFGASHIPTNTFFFSGANGANPNIPLVLGTNGNYYGLTFGGGSAGVGTVFDISPGGAFTSVDSFTASNGYSPNSLVAGKDGNFYVATGGGTTNFNTAGGTIVRLKYDGTLTILAQFNPTNGSGYMPTSLIQATDGTFYGTTSQGGSYSNGAVFMLSTNNVLTTIYSFTGGVDGSDPTSLIQGKDGNLYGTASSGGTFGKGNIFRVSVLPTPTFQSIVKSNSTVFLTWAAAAGHSYEVQFSTNLLQTNWINLKSVNTTNSVGSATDTNPVDTKRFYRILVLQ